MGRRELIVARDFALVIQFFGCDKDFARAFLKPSGGVLEKNLFQVYMKAMQFEEHLDNMRQIRVNVETVQNNVNIQSESVKVSVQCHWTKYIQQNLFKK